MPRGVLCARLGCTACLPTCTPDVHRMCMCTSQGHSHRKNLSDATLWLDHFQSPGGTVLGVDLLEDYALDLQHRYRLHPTR